MIHKAIQRATDHNVHYRDRICCVITTKNGIEITTGLNKHKSHPIQAFFASLVGKPEKIKLHAEIDALVKLDKKNINTQSDAHTAYIARVTKAGNTGLAKPCPVCEAALREYGIKRVVYTNGEDCNVIEESYEV